MVLRSVLGEKNVLEDFMPIYLFSYSTLFIFVFNTPKSLYYISSSQIVFDLCFLSKVLSLLLILYFESPFTCGSMVYISIFSSDDSGFRCYLPLISWFNYFISSFISVIASPLLKNGNICCLALPLFLTLAISHNCILPRSF